jgi:tetratricopeptide (TPR) repeat protein
MATDVRMDAESPDRRRPSCPVISLLVSRSCVLVSLISWSAVLAFTPLAVAQPVDIETYEVNFSRALLEFNNHRYGTAEELFSTALEAKPGDQEARYYLGHTLIRSRKYAAAETVFGAMLQTDPGSGRAHLGLGIARYNLQRYQQALASLEVAEQVMPGDLVVHYYQGLVLHKLGRYELSPERFLRVIAISPELAPTAHYYSGVAYYRRGLLEQAKAEFEAVVSLQPSSELARSAKDFLAQATAVETARTEEAPEKPRRWKLNANVSAEWDANVVLLPGDTQPPGGSTGISGKHDYRTVLSARAEYRPIQTDHWTVGSAYGIYQSFHRTLSGFDVEDHAPSIFVQHQRGSLQSSLQYGYEYIKVGRAPYLISNSVQPVFTLATGNRAFTQLQFRYQYKDFQHGLFELNGARDGINWLAGVTQYVLFAENQGILRVGYTYDTDRTGGGSPAVAPPPGTVANSDWAYKGHRFSAGLEAPLIWAIKTGLAFDYYRQDYDNPNTFSTDQMTRRRDHVYAFTGNLSRLLTDQFTLSVQYSYTRDQCNVSVFDYNRSIYSLTLSGSF